jgi:hypothetical protein
MAQYQAVIIKVLTNGPYAYALKKDGVGQKDVNNVASIAAALDGVKTDIAGLLGAEVVQQAVINVTSA